MALKGEKTDRQLILECLGGDLSSFEVIVKRYQNQIYFYILRFVKNGDAVEDVAQETFIRVFENLRSFDLGKPFKPWLYKIATNLTYDVLKKEKKFARLEWELEDERESTLGKMIKKEESQMVRKALKKLPKIYQRPIFGFYFQNLSYKALAKKLALPLNTLRTRLKRGKVHLAKEFNEKH